MVNTDYGLVTLPKCKHPMIAYTNILILENLSVILGSIANKVVLTKKNTVQGMSNNSIMRLLVRRDIKYKKNKD